MKIFLNLFFIYWILSSCQNNSRENKPSEAEVNEKLTEMNVQRVGDESKEIDDFILRHSIKAERTGTGLRYEIYQHGKGEKPAIHDEVELKYKVYLLDGKMCYTSDSTGPMKFHLGQGEQVRGLEEALMLMVPGDRARLVLPAHLAYGISGDEGKIPPASALYYEIEVLNNFSHEVTKTQKNKK